MSTKRKSFVFINILVLAFFLLEPCLLCGLITLRNVIWSDSNHNACSWNQEPAPGRTVPLLSLKFEYFSRASPAFPWISLSVLSGLCRRSAWAPVRVCGQDSPQAYGSAVYLQCVYRDATILSWLVALNCKVAPIKPMTKPRLELAGAVLALHLTQNLTLVLGLLMQAIIPTAWMYCGGA